MPRNRSKFPAAVIEANLTPMIDVTFLLIVFFTLVSGIADNERVDMSLARVEAGATAQADEESRVMLNVIPAANGQIGGYLLAGKAFDATPDGIAQLADALADGYRRNPNLAVNLRADRDTMYEWVEPAMRATTTAASLAGGGALPRLNLVVIEESIGGSEGGRDGS
jgi:biopolymer transport protein ExbD